MDKLPRAFAIIKRSCLGRRCFQMIKRIGFLAAIVGVVAVAFRAIQKMFGGGEADETAEG